MNDQRPLCARLIKAAREHRLFLTQADFAELIERLAREDGNTELVCDQSTVSHWERGRNIPALRYRKYIALALQMDASVLFTEVAA